MQVEPRNFPQECKPVEEPQVPAHQDELKERQADPRVPISRWGQPQVASFRRPVPSRRFQGNASEPDPMPDCVNENQQAHFECQGVATAGGAFDGGVKLWRLVQSNDPALGKAFDRSPQALMNNRFGSNEHRECDEESHMSFNIAQETQVCSGRSALNQAQDG